MSQLHVFIIPVWLNTSFPIAVSLIAIWRRDWRASIVAGTPIILLAAQYVFIWHPPWLWRALVDDGLEVGVCLACAFGSRRYWTIWASAFATAGWIGDLIAFSHLVTPWSAGSASLLWSYMTAGAALVGVVSKPRSSRHATSVAG